MRVNTFKEVGFVTEGLWMILLERSTKQRHKKRWDEHTHEKCEHERDHELMIDAGRFGHVCPPWFAPQILVTSTSNIPAVAANNMALHHVRNWLWS